MEKVSKTKTIIRAFTQDSEIDKAVLKHRRDTCAGCEYNSENIDDDNLTFVSKARKKLIKNAAFCTACGCQIDEKTSQETEECGLSEKGLTPKWNRVKVETVDKSDINLINNSSDRSNIDLSSDGKFFIMDLGEISIEELHKFELLIQAKDTKSLEINYFTPSCNACTEALCTRVNAFTYKAEIELNTEKLKGKFVKNIYFACTVSGDYKKNRIKIIGISK